MSVWAASVRVLALVLLIGLGLAGCAAPGPAALNAIAPTGPPADPIPTATAIRPAAVVPMPPSPSTTPAATAALPASPTSARPATTAEPAAGATATMTATPTIWPTVTRQVLPPDVAAGLAPCAERQVSDDLLIVVTQQFGLPESYVPPDLAPLSDYFSSGVTVGIESSVRVGLIEPLQRLLDAMHAAELAPSILSGYRSYGEQYLAWKWWNSQYPERVAIMSAPAGHSEHQLGTTVDFGSPALDHLFHVDFATTAEGLWLVENAHLYGFTMSYPADSYAITGFKYEPWHFRYVGPELATALRDSGQTLTEWQLANLPPPCIP
jgi:D-alanyl-D-alanine carboxypeptidase